MTIAIFGKQFDQEFLPKWKELISLLEKGKVNILIYEAFNEYLKKHFDLQHSFETFSNHTDIVGKINCLFSIGGDGTLLDTLSLVRDSKIPVLGINAGRLGFLSSISKGEVKKAVQEFLNGSWRTEKRTMLQLDMEKNFFGSVNYALNELTVHKKDSSSMITINVYIDDQYLNSYWADGLIIATPTGSTAYSLSCGGPIMVPGSQNFIITPIAPHNLNVRPVVVPDNGVITLELEGRDKHFLLSLDSRSVSIGRSHKMTIKKAKAELHLVQLENQNFYNTIRNKLNWGLDKRN